MNFFLQVMSTGYHYEAQSDSCIAVKNNKITYEDVDNICAEDRGYAAVLSTSNLLNMADHILKQSGENEAWINPPYRTYEKFAHNRGRWTPITGFCSIHKNFVST